MILLLSPDPFTSYFQKLKKGASLVEAPNIDRKLKEEDLKELFSQP
jgi:hypothetical protein